MFGESTQMLVLLPCLFQYRAEKDQARCQMRFICQCPPNQRTGTHKGHRTFIQIRLTPPGNWEGFGGNEGGGGSDKKTIRTELDSEF